MYCSPKIFWASIGAWCYSRWPRQNGWARSFQIDCGFNLFWEVVLGVSTLCVAHILMIPDLTVNHIKRLGNNEVACVSWPLTIGPHSVSAIAWNFSDMASPIAFGKWLSWQESHEGVFQHADCWSTRKASSVKLWPPDWATTTTETRTLDLCIVGERSSNAQPRACNINTLSIVWFVAACTLHLCLALGFVYRFGRNAW